MGKLFGLVHEDLDFILIYKEVRKEINTQVGRQQVTRQVNRQVGRKVGRQVGKYIQLSILGWMKGFPRLPRILVPVPCYQCPIFFLCSLYSPLLKGEMFSGDKRKGKQVEKKKPTRDKMEKSNQGQLLRTSVGRERKSIPSP